MPQESGSVNAFREAVVKIRFVKAEVLECIVDTGFDGALILPGDVAERLRLPVVARLAFELVGGARMTADVALGDIEWLGQRRTVEIILSEGNDSLIGTEMFEGCRLLIDYTSRSLSISQKD